MSEFKPLSRFCFVALLVVQLFFFVAKGPMQSPPSFQYRPFENLVTVFDGVFLLQILFLSGLRNSNFQTLTHAHDLSACLRTCPLRCLVHSS